MLQKLRIGLVFRYFLSYMLILCIPLSILGVVMYKNTVLSLQSEIEDSNLSKLEQVKETVDLSMQGLIRTTAQISIDASLTPYMVKYNGYNASEAVKELTRYRDNIGIADEIILHFRGDNNLYTTSGTSDFAALNSLMYEFTLPDGENLSQHLDQNTAMEVVFARNKQPGSSEASDLLAILIPLPNSSAIPHGSVIYLVRESFLTDRIENVLGDFDGSVYIFDENNRKLASKNQDLFVAEDDMKELSEQYIEPGIFQIRMNKSKLSLLYAESDYTHWKYVAFMPRNQFFHKVFEMRSFIILLTAMIMVLGAIFSILFSYGNYRPIQKLSKLIAASRHGEEKSANRSEMDIIHDSVNSALRKIDEQKPLVQQRLLFQLLKGSLIPSTDHYPELQTLQAGTTIQHYYVVVIANDKKEFTEKLNGAALMQLLTPLQYRDWSFYPVDLLDEHEAALIVCIGQEAEAFSSEHKKQLAKEITSKFEQSGQEIPAIGVGKTYRELYQVNRSFIEASAALEYKFTVGRGKAILFDQVSAYQEKSSWYPIEEELTFVQSLKRGDSNLALQTLHEMFRSIALQEQSILLLKCMCFDIINTVLKTINEMNLPSYTENVRGLLLFQSIDEVETGLAELVTELCEHVNRTKESKNTAMLDEVLHYIQENYHSYELSLEALADTFQVNASYLSRFIKDQTGSTFTEYMFQLRMEQAKWLLRTSDKAIKDIISEVGYVDVSNFMRRFKKAQGITPGEYRKLHSEA
ncbi:helix-turn-helix domain-containing protein [Paenibacillus sp. strain BS8-2]